MRWGCLLLVLGLLTAGTPGVAEHFSIGASGSTAEAGEEPSDPSVDAEMYARGIQRGCPQSPQGADDAPPSHDAMCGALLYHEGTRWEQAAPPDQDLRANVGTFDVQRTHNVGTYGLHACQPWCAQPSLTAPAYDTVNTLAWQAGLSPSDWSDEADRGYQHYGGGWQLTHAGALLEDETGLVGADGWMPPSLDQTFVGILEDEEGTPIGESQLQRLVWQQDGLAPTAIPAVCGFSPSIEQATTDSRIDCDVRFHWNGAEGGHPDNRCHSPGYVCGVSQPAWQGKLVCVMVTGSCQEAVTSARLPQAPEQVSRDPIAQAPGEALANHSTTEPVVWHFVAAGVPSDCQGHREPGFDASPPNAAHPYLAHDLDVYLPPDDRLGEQAATATVPWAEQTVLPPIAQAPRQASQPAWQTPAPEPNHEASYAGLQDTSKRWTIEREWSPCQAIQPPSESPDHVDPWVNLLDARLEDTHTGPLVEGSIQAPTSLEGERARTGTYTSTGRAVYAADTDDDGAYSDVAWEQQFEAPARTGVYPILWDMHVTPEGSPDLEEGCAIHGGLTGTDLTLTEAMVEAGYRAHTGLVQAIALDEPVAWTYQPTGDRIAYPEGGVFVFASQAPHQLALDEPAASVTMREHVDAVVEAAASAAGLAEEEAIVPRHELAVDDLLGAGSDFQAQCGQPAGGFTSAWSLTRACLEAASCGQAASVTRLVFAMEDPVDGFHQGATWAQAMGEVHAEAFSTGQHVWTDVDRLGDEPR